MARRNRSHTYATSATLRADPEGDEVDLIVAYSVSGRYQRATRLDPAEYAEVEVDEIRTETGLLVTANEIEPADWARSLDRLDEHAAEAERDAYEDAMERRADEARDARWERDQ